jgi:hypothetical protein
MKYKVGDTVRIRSKEWMEAQEKSAAGSICDPGGAWAISPEMQKCAGGTAKIVSVDDGAYRLDVDDERWYWEDWMFDPDFKADEPLSEDDPLSEKEAVLAMLAGETLVDSEGYEYFWGESELGNMTFKIRGWGGNYLGFVNKFHSLRRRPAKSKRLMTRWEALGWASSDASHGWVVRQFASELWKVPQFYEYNQTIDTYQRARLRSDGSGVDEDTVQGFEVEE